MPCPAADPRSVGPAHGLERILAWLEPESTHDRLEVAGQAARRESFSRKWHGKRLVGVEDEVTNCSDDVGHSATHILKLQQRQAVA